MNTFEKIYEEVKKIPKGSVAAYGLIAAKCGNPRWARVVGYALHVNPDPENIPCHRVVTKNGKTSSAFAFGGEDVQKKMLQAEGITFLENGLVDMKKHIMK